MSDCMACAHGVIFKDPSGKLDFGKRLCVEAPPQMVAIPVGPGALNIQPMFPVVGPGVRCSRWLAKPSVAEIVAKLDSDGGPAN